MNVFCELFLCLSLSVVIMFVIFLDDLSRFKENIVPSFSILSKIAFALSYIVTDGDFPAFFFIFYDRL